MKITIDFNDPAFQKQIETAINNKLNELIAEKIQGVIEKILETKTERMNELWLEKQVQTMITSKINEYFVQKAWGVPSEFQKILAIIAERILKEKLAKDLI